MPHKVKLPTTPEFYAQIKKISSYFFTVAIFLSKPTKKASCVVLLKLDFAPLPKTLICMVFFMRRSYRFNFNEKDCIAW